MVHLDNGTVDFIKSPGDGIQNLAVNTNYGSLAFSEDGLHARIFVYEIGNLSQPHSVLSGRYHYTNYMANVTLGQNSNMTWDCKHDFHFIYLLLFATFRALLIIIKWY